MSHVSHENIINDLIMWIEDNLKQPLSLDIVAAKAGYSKWHLQRIFMQVTGNSLGAYIRERKLSNAAIDLYWTNQSILNIALEYSFDSQQTFNRAFKKQFSCPPGRYRHENEWNTACIRPSIRLNEVARRDLTLRRRQAGQVLSVRYES